MDLAGKELVARAEHLYEQKWKKQLEQTHRDFFLSIEPKAETYFLGKTFLEATAAARQGFPDRLHHTIRIGHAATFFIG